MDIEEFLDKLYAGWAKTTGAENRFWAVKRAEEYSALFNIYAMDEQGDQRRVAEYLEEVDADFLATVHGAIPDLVRVTRTALDDAERMSLDRDQQEGRIADLELEILGLKQALDAR